MTTFRSTPRAVSVGALALTALAGWSTPAHAHVKWFSEFSFGDRPLTLAQAITPAFLALALLSTVTIGALVWVDRSLGGAG